jgi:hypothetical protein
MAEEPSAHIRQVGDGVPESAHTPALADASQRPKPAEGARSTSVRPPRRPPPSPLAVIAVTLGLFFIVLTLLAIQVRNGRDPALGPGPVVPTTGQPISGGTQAQKATKIVSRTSPVPP